MNIVSSLVLLLTASSAFAAEFPQRYEQAERQFARARMAGLDRNGYPMEVPLGFATIATRCQRYYNNPRRVEVTPFLVRFDFSQNEGAIVQTNMTPGGAIVRYTFQNVGQPEANTAALIDGGSYGNGTYTILKNTPGSDQVFMQIVVKQGDTHTVDSYLVCNRAR